MSFTNTAMSERLHILFNKQLHEQLSPGERIELLGLFLEPSLQTQLQQLVEGAWNNTGEEEDMTVEKSEMMFRQII
ncbi:MAG TPA: hypothetical protein VHM26_05465, partial [Chitinophagaceae bacterium]|nr:hypothetical protein [Chitinophagaceae bacterium]